MFTLCFAGILVDLLSYFGFCNTLYGLIVESLILVILRK